MSGIFGGAKPTPKPEKDPELVAAEAEKKRLLEEEEEAQRIRDEDARRARLRGLRGQRSLLAAGSKGFADPDAAPKTTELG